MRFFADGGRYTESKSLSGREICPMKIAFLLLCALRRVLGSALPLATDETAAICMEFEKMNTMQAMSAKAKRTRIAMSQGEVFCILDSVGNSFPRISPEP